MATYITRLMVTEEHEYSIEARTPEEAESIAEGMYAEGQDGTITSTNVEAWDTFPVEAEGTDAV